MKPGVEYLPDSAVDEKLDRELRDLFTVCFTKPQDIVFRERRYFVVPYAHRWVIRGERSEIVSHAGVHERLLECGNEQYCAGGIAEVCVHPGFRGRGYVRIMLAEIHQWLKEEGFVFAVLFGNPRVYESSGYREVSNIYCGVDGNEWKQVPGMMKELGRTSWPKGEVHVPGGKF